MLNRIWQILLPEWCNFCQRNLSQGGQVFCEDCQRSLKAFTNLQRCPICLSRFYDANKALPSCHYCASRNVYFHKLDAIFSYKSIGKTLLKSAKFQQRWRARSLVKSFLQDRLPTNSTLLPLPSSKPLVREMAETIGKAQDNNVIWLFKKKRGAKQNKYLKEGDRFHNIKEQLFINEKLWPPQSLKKQIVLFDDVWTTGATINYAAYLLHQLGIAKEQIHALVLFRRDRYTSRKV